MTTRFGGHLLVTGSGAHGGHLVSSAHLAPAPQHFWAPSRISPIPQVPLTTRLIPQPTTSPTEGPISGLSTVLCCAFFEIPLASGGAREPSPLAILGFPRGLGGVGTVVCQHCKPGEWGGLAYASNNCSSSSVVQNFCYSHSTT